MVNNLITELSKRKRTTFRLFNMDPPFLLPLLGVSALYMNSFFTQKTQIVLLQCNTRLCVVFLIIYYYFFNECSRFFPLCVSFFS